MSDSDSADGMIVSAGAVVWRPAPVDQTGVEICLVHRPRYDDWSLPKGKLDHGEHVLACAVREVDEETGHRVILGRPLPIQYYEVNGVPKRVHYWAARADDSAPEWTGTKEVDEIEFLPAADAIRRLTHSRDADVVTALLNNAVRTVPFVVLRHTSARDRESWSGPDTLRPLNEHGARDARLLVAPFAALGLTRVVSSDATRCVDSVRPYADATGTRLEREPALAEERDEEHALGAEKLTRALLADGKPTVVCSHRPVLPEIIGAAAEQAPDLAPSEPLHVGDFLVFHHDGGVPLAVERFSI